MYECFRPILLQAQIGQLENTVALAKLRVQTLQAKADAGEAVRQRLAPGEGAAAAAAGGGASAGGAANGAAGGCAGAAAAAGAGHLGDSVSLGDLSSKVVEVYARWVY
jgi:hypothetical protein